MSGVTGWRSREGAGARTPTGQTTAVKRCAGIKVNARGINFNKHVTGDNLIVMLP